MSECRSFDAALCAASSLRRNAKWALEYTLVPASGRITLPRLSRVVWTEFFSFSPCGGLSLPNPDKSLMSVLAYPHPSLLSSLNLPDLVWSLCHVFLAPACGLLSPLPTKGMFNVPLLGLSGTTWSYFVATEFPS